jgi:flagellar hook-associated protein 2
MSKIDEVTAKGADLQRETSLTSLKSTLRNYANGSNSSVDGAYHLLSQLGITTMQANSDNLSTDTNKLQFDEEAFKQALEEDPDSLEALIGSETGILGQMESALETSLKAVSGFFDVKQATYDSEISRAESKVKKQQEKISTYKAQLEKRFSAMETLISQMQQNYSSFLTTGTGY